MSKEYNTWRHYPHVLDRKDSQILDLLEVTPIIRKQRQIVAQRRRADQEIEVGDKSTGPAQSSSLAPENARHLFIQTDERNSG